MFVFDIKKYYFEKNSKINIFFTNDQFVTKDYYLYLILIRICGCKLLFSDE